MKAGHLSVWAYADTLKIVNKEQRYSITVSFETSGQERANGNLEYSSITVRVYYF